MPVLTRKQKRLLEEKECIRSVETPVEPTNVRTKKQPKKKPEIDSSQEMNISTQNTVEIPKEVLNANGRKRKATKKEVSVANQLEVAVDLAKKSRIEDPEKLPAKEISESVTKEISTSDKERKRKAAKSSHDDEAKKARRIENAPNETSEDSTSSQDQIRALKIIKKMHEENFMNVAERLQLDPVPLCLYNLKKCHDQHKVKNVVKTFSHTTKITLLDALSIDTRIWRFINGMKHNVLASKLFPGTDILAKMIDQILKLSPQQDCNINFDLTELHNVFTDIIDHFPPCHIRANYLKVFRTNFSIEGIQERKQLLPTVLEQLSDLIFARHTQAEQTRKYNDDVAYNFDAWDQYHQEKTFAYFSINDKFERLFLVLDLIVRILEHDTSIFIIKHSHKFASSIFNDKLKPLICSVIWQSQESVIVINSIIKQLISIFVAMVALQYPADNIKILSRLLTLVSHVINMYEYPDDTFQYPIYKNYSIDFAREIQKCIEKSNYFSLHLHQRVVESIRSPLVRMLLMSFMITKVTGNNWSDSLSVAVNFISSGQVNNFEEKPRNELQKSAERYPKFDDGKKIKKCKVVQSDYIQMLLNYTEAVDSFYGISKACFLIGAPESATNAKKESNKETNVEDLSTILNSKVDLRKIDLNFKKMVHIRFTMQNSEFYLIEMNNFRDLIKSIKQWHSKYGSKFDAWMNFVQQIKAKYSA